MKAPGDAGILASSKRLAERLWYARSRSRLLNFPIPCRLPYGGWFRAYGDAMGARVLGYRVSRHPYEEGPWHLVSRLLPKGGTFVDIGANQGFYTILASRRVGRTGSVYAFEPAPTEFRKLEANLRLNRCRNVTLEKVAIGAEEGLAQFHMYLGHQGSWSGLRAGADDVEVMARLIEVRVTSLDRFFGDNAPGRLDVMKIDVEGGELHVIQGATGLLKRLRPLILCEVEARRTRQWGYEAREILSLLESLGYEWHSVTPGGCLGGRTTDDTGWQNLAAIPIEKVAELTALELRRPGG